MMKRILILLMVVLSMVGVVLLKKSKTQQAPPLPTHTAGMPRLLDLGSKDCTACAMLVPVLEELRTTYTNRLQVDFIDVWQHTNVSDQYGVELIPTQIFFDAEGKELDRHQGFISVEEVEAKFAELGVSLNAE